MDLRARLTAVLRPIPSGSLVPRDWLLGMIEEAGETDDDDLTAEEFGRLRNRAPSTIRTWAAAGRLPGAYRLNGREWRIPRSALRALRENGRGEEAEQSPGDGDLSGWREHLR